MLIHQQQTPPTQRYVHILCYLRAVQAEGAMVTWRVDMNRALASTGTMAPTKVLVSSGVMTTAAKVLTVVIMTLSATSAFARKVTTLLAVPPGQLATRQILRAAKYDAV